MLDFSSAVSWVLAGFIAGLLVYWLVRRLMGIDARRLDEIATLNASIEETRRAHMNLAGTNAQLEAERSRLTAEVNQLSPRAALLPQFERQVAELKQASSTAQAAVDAGRKELDILRQQTASEIASLRQEADVKGSTAKYYEDEYGRLHAAHQALNSDWSSASGLVSKLQADYAAASREAQEATRLRSEMASARAEIDSLRADIANAKALAQSDAARLAQEADTRLKAAQQMVSGRDGEIASLRAEITRLGEETGRLRTAAAESANLSSEVNRLKAQEGQLRAAESARAELAGEVTRLKAALDAAPKEDLSDNVTRLNGEVAQLSAALESVRTQERSTAMELHATRTDLTQVRTALEETTRLLGERHGEVESLRARLAAMPDVESYRRFKDALDAANRIAAGLPEKA